jgi:hypothetical protein
MFNLRQFVADLSLSLDRYLCDFLHKRIEVADKDKIFSLIGLHYRFGHQCEWICSKPNSFQNVFLLTSNLYGLIEVVSGRKIGQAIEQS